MCATGCGVTANTNTQHAPTDTQSVVCVCVWLPKSDKGACVCAMWSKTPLTFHMTPSPLCELRLQWLSTPAPQAHPNSGWGRARQ